MNETLPVDSEFFAANLVPIAIGAGAVLAFTLAWCCIFRKAGYNAATGLLMVVPGVNMVMLFVLAFRPWPVNREAKALRGIRNTIHREEQRSLRQAA